jgi:hypothetical protein
MLYIQDRSLLFTCKQSFHFLFFASVIFLFSSCKELEKQDVDNNRSASGALSELVVASAEFMMDSTVKSEVKTALSPFVPSLPVKERYFTVYYTHEDIFTDYFKRHYNLVVLVTGNMVRNPQDYPFMPRSIAQQWSSDETPTGTRLMAKNVWSDDQTVLFLYVHNKERCLQYLKSPELEDIPEILLDKEAEKKRKELNASSKPEFKKQMLQTRKYGIHLPVGYRVAINDSDLVWLRKETPDVSYGIFVYDSDYENIDQSSPGRIVFERNERLKRVPGPTKGSYMSTEPQVEPTFRPTRLEGQYTMETRGWFRVENDFMGGPFISYTILDTTINKVVTLEGYVYAPGEDKWKHVRELELILRNYDHAN